MKKLNIPISLLNRLKADKSSIEMMACALMIKREYQHSVLYGVSVTNVMSFFGVSHKKAVKLLQSFRESELFLYNPLKKALYAKSFKSKEKVIYGKGKYEAYSDYCYKMETDKSRLRDVVRELRKVLVLNAINTRERLTQGDNLISSKHSVTQPACIGKALPQRVIGTVINMSRSSAARYLRELEADKRVSKTKMVAECVIPVLNADTERKWRENHPKGKFYVWHSIIHGGWSAWYMYGFDYHICNRSETVAFQNVIWNYDYSKRKGAHLPKPKTSCELDGKW